MGFGAFGSVYKCKLIEESGISQHSNTVAVKTLTGEV